MLHHIYLNVNPSSQKDKEALALTKKWQASGGKPVAGPDGAIVFLFGASQPSLVCAVLQVCDIELQPGEEVNSIHLGDTARWLIEPALTGANGAEVQHLIVKPLDVGLETSLIVTTNRRTYHLRLRSHRSEFMARVSFVYPEEAAAKWAALKNRESRDKAARILPGTNQSLDGLDFGDHIKGAASWKPVRVYNDGHKTIIQLPASVTSGEAPTLLVVRQDGGLFSDDETVTVNYRLQGDRYIVDSLFDKAILIAGVGEGQERITLQREGK